MCLMVQYCAPILSYLHSTGCLKRSLVSNHKKVLHKSIPVPGYRLPRGCQWHFRVLSLVYYHIVHVI